MSGPATAIYNAVFKRTSTFVAGIAVSMFFFERTFDIIADSIFENYNKGKLYKDLKLEE